MEPGDGKDRVLAAAIADWASDTRVSDHFLNAGPADAWPPVDAQMSHALQSIPITPFHGPGLMQLLAAAAADCEQGLPIGTRVWAKVRGFCSWPGVTWSPALVRKGDVPDLLRSYAPGHKLVHFYGEHNCSWCSASSLQQCAPLISSDVAAADTEAAEEGDCPTPPAAQDGSPSMAVDEADQGAGVMMDDDPSVGQASPADVPLYSHAQRLEDMRAWGKKFSRVKLVAAACWEMDGCLEEGAAEVCRLLRLSEVWGAREDLVPDRVCGCCGENRAQVACSACNRAAHALCLDPPSLDIGTMREQGTWMCPKCGNNNDVQQTALAPVVEPPPKKKRGRPRKVQEGAKDAASSSTGHQAPEEDKTDKLDKQDEEKLGLTPDWIIYTVCHHIFGLERPRPGTPYIAGLLDPCSNSKLAPNVPAQVLYDATDNGLLLANSWAGHYILLNPDYRSQTQWRFVNRAIDEVETGNVPAVLLLCRNSTDAAYFQRLRPYPRVLLRRNSAHFKDYDRTTPGFGIAAILLATPDKTGLYLRFHQGFSHAGEASIPIDATFMSSPSFLELCSRLRTQAQHHQRDHWVQCCQCAKWRIIPYHAVLGLQDGTWCCTMLRPPHTNCRTALTRTEQLGMTYAHSARGVPGEGGSEVMGLPVWHQSSAQQRVKASKRIQIEPPPAAAAAAPSTGDCPDDPQGTTGQQQQQQQQQDMALLRTPVKPAPGRAVLSPSRRSARRSGAPPPPAATLTTTLAASECDVDTEHTEHHVVNDPALVLTGGQEQDHVLQPHTSLGTQLQQCAAVDAPSAHTTNPTASPLYAPAPSWPMDTSTQGCSAHATTTIPSTPPLPPICATPSQPTTLTAGPSAAPAASGILPPFHSLGATHSLNQHPVHSVGSCRPAPLPPPPTPAPPAPPPSGHAQQFMPTLAGSSVPVTTAIMVNATSCSPLMDASESISLLQNWAASLSLSGALSAQGLRATAAPLAAVAITAQGVAAKAPSPATPARCCGPEQCTTTPQSCPADSHMSGQVQVISSHPPSSLPSVHHWPQPSSTGPPAVNHHRPPSDATQAVHPPPGVPSCSDTAHATQDPEPALHPSIIKDLNPSSQQPATREDGAQPEGQVEHGTPKPADTWSGARSARTRLTPAKLRDVGPGDSDCLQPPSAAGTATNEQAPEDVGPAEVTWHHLARRRTGRVARTGMAVLLEVLEGGPDSEAPEGAAAQASSCRTRRQADVVESALRSSTRHHHAQRLPTRVLMPAAPGRLPRRAPAPAVGPPPPLPPRPTSQQLAQYLNLSRARPLGQQATIELRPLSRPRLAVDASATPAAPLRPAGVTPRPPQGLVITVPRPPAGGPGSQAPGQGLRPRISRGPRVRLIGNKGRTSLVIKKAQAACPPVSTAAATRPGQHVPVARESICGTLHSCQALAHTLNELLKAGAATDVCAAHRDTGTQGDIPASGEVCRAGDVRPMCSVLVSHMQSLQKSLTDVVQKLSSLSV